MIYGNDANIAYVKDYLENQDKSYRDSLQQILHQQLEESIKSVAHDGELLKMGVIKRSNSYSLIIRNEIYKEVLRTVFGSDI